MSIGHASLIVKFSWGDGHTSLIMTFFGGDEHTSLIVTSGLRGGADTPVECDKIICDIRMNSNWREQRPIEVGVPP